MCVVVDINADVDETGVTKVLSREDIDTGVIVVSEFDNVDSVLVVDVVNCLNDDVGVGLVHPLKQYTGAVSLHERKRP